MAQYKEVNERFTQSNASIRDFVVDALAQISAIRKSNGVDTIAVSQGLTTLEKSLAALATTVNRLQAGH